MDEHYVIVGHGRHHDDVPPDKGIYRGGARETRRAEVFTEVTPGRGVATLRAELRQIDLPVFHAVLDRPLDRAEPEEDVTAQQQ